MPYSDTVRKLKKNQGVARLLRELATQGPKPRSRSRTGEAARLAGYTQDVVVTKGGLALPEDRARKAIGADWFKHTQSTGLEAITDAGLEALQELDNAG